MKIVFATNNAHKLAEVQAVLGDAYELVTPRMCGVEEEIPENQPTLEGNASEKSHYLRARTGLDCFADDTGLEVEALDGAPGVHSARYASDGHDFAANNRLLLRNLEGVANRRARFRTVISLLVGDEEHLFEGVVEGRIVERESGAEGFGYDPLFVPDGCDRTFAEMSPDEKNAVSHRGRAVRKLAAFLRAAAKSDTPTSTLRPMTDKALLLHWLAACSGPLLAAGAAQAQQAAPAQRPNILFILTDDQRWDAVGYVNPIVRTPHIDSLAREGVCFRNAFVTTPISAASRASLLTGMYERTHGYTFRQGPLKEPYMQQSYPVLLCASGYTTAYFGKFGVTYPGAQRLFDAADLYDRRGKFPDRRGYFYKTIDGDTVHLTRYTGYEAQRFLREVDPSKPFCLSLGFSAPHAHDPAPEQYFWEPWADSLYRDLTVAPPLLADDRYFEELPEAVRRGYNRVRWTWRYDTPQKYQHSVKGYYRMISEVDREVGAIRQVLRERGLDRNTIIVFMGDNGYFLGERQLAGKWLMYDRSLRVPMLIYDPRGRDPREVEDMVLNIDVPATILDAAGVAVPEAYQGVSLLGYTRGEAPAADREAFLCEHLWELDEIPSSEGIRTERWKYMRYRFIPGREELYDLAADPEEAVNLASDPAYGRTLEELRRECDRQIERYVSLRRH